MKLEKEPTYLVQGCESKERVELILSLTDIRSDMAIRCIIHYLVDGWPKKEVSKVHDHFSRDIAIVNRKAGIVEKIKELDWAKFKKENQRVTQ